MARLLVADAFYLLVLCQEIAAFIAAGNGLQRLLEFHAAGLVEVLTGLDDVRWPNAPEADTTHLGPRLKLLQAPRLQKVPQRLDRAHPHLCAAARGQNAVAQFFE